MHVAMQTRDSEVVAMQMWGSELDSYTDIMRYWGRQLCRHVFRQIAMQISGGGGEGGGGEGVSVVGSYADIMWYWGR